ncbi:cbb3-type cytochrome c oxidase subunit I [Aeropyrum pernix]|uniref:cbb3-type cytochrome c oxidase subunit I n=1 Tax=Aeropyrum pernix TaxID=56636 RepID=UPI0013052373|nr:cbb3-type cytochrome c oxidase subunit I [Aeropyrum pernix]
MSRLRGFLAWVYRWITTTDHKDIGLLYLVTSIAFLLIAGSLALLFRVQLAIPKSNFLTGDAYYEAVTVHGLIMLLWFASPFAFGLANYIVPLQIGARDLAFPRLNALSYWLYLLSGLVLLASFFTESGAPNVGWTLYAPLTARIYTPGIGLDLAALAIFLFSLSVTLGTINFLVTIAAMRAPGIGWFKMPMFTWSILFTVILMLWAFPPLMVGGALLLLDRNLGTEFFLNPAGGALLWDHLFWFFGHPEVYILLFPALGAMADVISTFSGKPIYAKRYILTAFLIATIISFVVWMHHMFITGTNIYTRLFYSITTILISIPFEMAVMSFIFTLYKGRLVYTVPMLFAVGALLNFIIGGSTGVYLGSIAIDRGFRGTYWVVAHFHYILVGTVTLGLIAGLYYWWPKITGRTYSERLGKIHFALAMLGVALTFLPQFALMDMPRRYFTYDIPEWVPLNQLSTLGAFIFGGSMAIGLVNFLYSLVKGGSAAPNPWNSWTLEWFTNSPPPKHNFDGVPVVRKDNTVVFVSEEALSKYGKDAIVEGRVDVSNVPLSGGQSHSSHGLTHHGTTDPLVLAAGLTLALFGLFVSKPLSYLGAIVFLLSLARWLWKDVKNVFAEELPGYVEHWPFPKDKIRSAMWVFIASEVATFGSIFSAYFFIRFNPVGKFLTEAWPPGYLVHDVNVGLINTIILFTGTMLFTLAYLGVKRDNYLITLSGLLGTLFMAIYFLTVKYFEWKELLIAGLGLDAGMYMQAYYVTTGAHALHVILGVLATTYLLVKLFNGNLRGRQALSEVLAVGIYWGIVEIVWTLVFPLYYLV